MLIMLGRDDEKPPRRGFTITSLVIAAVNMPLKQIVAPHFLKHTSGDDGMAVLFIFGGCIIALAFLGAILSIISLKRYERPLLLSLVGGALNIIIVFLPNHLS